MSLDKLLVLIGGTGLIGLIWWFFFGGKEKPAVAEGKIDVLVSGGYKPSIIKIKKGKKTTISLTRTDENSCLEEFILPDFKIKKYLPLGEKIEIIITPKEKGEYKFHCGMNMFHGKVVVV